MSDAFKDVNKTLGLKVEEEEEKEEENSVELERIAKLKEENQNIENDFQYVRLSIITDVETAEGVISKLKGNIMKSAKEESANDMRYLARKGEILGQLLKVKNDLRKELMSVYKSRRDLIFEDKSKLEEEESNSDIKNMSDILKAFEKEKMIRRKETEKEDEEDLF